MREHGIFMLRSMHESFLPAARTLPANLILLELKGRKYKKLLLGKFQFIEKMFHYMVYSSRSI